MGSACGDDHIRVFSLAERARAHFSYLKSRQVAPSWSRFATGRGFPPPSPNNLRPSHQACSTSPRYEKLRQTCSLFVFWFAEQEGDGHRAFSAASPSVLEKSYVASRKLNARLLLPETVRASWSMSDMAMFQQSRRAENLKVPSSLDVSSIDHPRLTAFLNSEDGELSRGIGRAHRRTLSRCRKKTIFRTKATVAETVVCQWLPCPCRHGSFQTS
jgi:hypothetical protein